ncbi:hypothetical protein ACHAXR_008624 [Thalassiosira sp. AJA248-18]
MSTVNLEPECAACGTQGGEYLKACIACKLVKYCNVTCQKAHFPKHERECKKRAAALFDEALFQQPPSKEDCPICFLRLPSEAGETAYQPCCGKTLCTGCMYEMRKETNICPFCRTPAAVSEEEFINMCKNRMEAGDAEAVSLVGWGYLHGEWGLYQNNKKALKLLLRAAELGSANAHDTVATIYSTGEFVEKDEKKALYHFQRGAMGGCEVSRHNLGCLEDYMGNIDRAMKHWLIAAATGNEDSLNAVRKSFSHGHVTKVEYEKALRAYQNYLGEVKSDQRERGKELQRDAQLQRDADYFRE